MPSLPKTVPAKCPYCDTGCDECEGGFIQVRIDLKGTYGDCCGDCKRPNGGRIVMPGYPLPDKPPACVFCGSDNTYWYKA